MSERERLQELAEMPIGGAELRAASGNGYLQLHQPEALEAARRAKRKWLPDGKKAVSGRAIREREQAFYANQTDLEDVVHAAGGERGSLSA